MMLARSLSLVLALAAMAALSACETPAPAGKLPVLSFANKRPITLDVGHVIIDSEYQSPGKRPNIEQEMPLSPEGAAIRWAQDRLKPVGRSGYARMIVKDARVVEVPLATDKGFTGLFKSEQSERYDGTLDVAIQILDERRMPLADVMARATRSRTVPEGISLAERDKTMFEISEALIKDIDGQMDGLLRTYMAKWVVAQ